VGVDEDRLRNLANNFKPRSDLSYNVRAGRPQPLNEEQLAEMGTTSQEIAKKPREERQEMIDKYFNRPQ
jgi:transposase